MLVYVLDDLGWKVNILSLPDWKHDRAFQPPVSLNGDRGREPSWRLPVYTEIDGYYHRKSRKSIRQQFTSKIWIRFVTNYTIKLILTLTFWGDSFWKHVYSMKREPYLWPHSCNYAHAQLAVEQQTTFPFINLEVHLDKVELDVRKPGILIRC